MLYLAIYLYYLFEDKNFLATPKNIFLLFSVLGVCIVVCYFFSYFFNIYARPIGLLALLALLLLGMRDAIFLNIIFALMMFSIDNFTNFSTDYVVALNCTPLITFTAGMVAIFAGSKVKTRLRSFCSVSSSAFPYSSWRYASNTERGAIWSISFCSG